MNNGLESLNASFVWIHPQDSNIIFAAVNRNLYRSTNGAADWTKIIYTEFVFDLAINPLNPNNMFLSTSRGLMESDDGGLTWEKIFNMADWNNVIFDHTNPSIAYATGDRKVYKSTDNGVSWGEIMTGLPNTNFHNIVIDPFDEQTLYLASENGVYQSLNGGLSWQKFSSSGLLTDYIFRIIVNHGYPSLLFAETDDFGLYSTRPIEYHSLYLPLVSK